MGMEENQFVEVLQSQEDSASSSSTITDLLEDDDASSPSPTSSPNSPSMDGPLNHLSELFMTQLPIKRGLSKYYGGKSQSFTSLASVKSLEDLPKKENPYNMRMKMCRSYGGGLDGHYQNQQSSQRFCSPKHTISKRMSSRGSFLSTMVVVGRSDLISTCNRPPISIQK